MEARIYYEGYVIDIVKDYTPSNPEDFKEEYEGNLEVYERELQAFKDDNVWGYVILDEDLDIVDAVWGFYGNPTELGILDRAKHNIDRRVSKSII